MNRVGSSYVSLRQCEVVGYPLKFGKLVTPNDFSCERLRKHGLVSALMKTSYTVDLGDLTVNPSEFEGQPEIRNCKNAGIIGWVNSKLAASVYKSRSEKKMAMTIGGDHSCGIGTIAGVLRANPNAAIFWVDAQANINTPDTTISGQVHGMMLAFLLNHNNIREKIAPLRWLRDYPVLQPHQLIYIGLRDVDVAERNIICNSGIKAYTMQDVDHYGIAKVMEMAFDAAIGREMKNIHLSVDVDAIDNIVAFSTGSRARGGLTYREASYIFEACAETGLLASCDVVGESDEKVVGEKGMEETIETSIMMLRSAMGAVIL